MEPRGVAITPNGAFAYVTTVGSNTVSVIATATNTVVATIGVGSTPLGAAINPFYGAYGGETVYVTNANSNNVSVIATVTNTVVGTVGVSAGASVLRLMKVL